MKPGYIGAPELTLKRNSGNKKSEERLGTPPPRETHGFLHQCLLSHSKTGTYWSDNPAWLSLGGRCNLFTSDKGEKSPAYILLVEA